MGMGDDGPLDRLPGIDEKIPLRTIESLGSLLKDCLHGLELLC
jgi:hypothetical protein